MCGLTLASSSAVIERSSAVPVARRDFVRTMIGMSAGLAFPRALQTPTLRFAVLGVANRETRQYDSFRDGVALGQIEAARAASLFSKGRLEYVGLSEHGLPVRASGVAAILARRGAQVILASLNDEDAHTAADECDRARVIFLNCGARSDSLRRELCSPFVFHIEASNAMYSAAQRLAPGADIVLWHPRLERYGAAQLNDRFEAAEGAPMTSKEWAGWFAMKVVWESFLRAKGADPESLAYYMSGDGAQYDGHKGAPLSFRKWDRQLRQPLYAVDKAKSGDARAIRDIPDAARSSMSVRDLLDTIGDDASFGRCRQP